MPPRMSCAMTIEPVRQRTKTATRRHPDTWQTLKPGDRLVLVEKAMGLPKGAKQVVLAEVEIVSNWIETLGELTDAEILAEGFEPGAPLPTLKTRDRSFATNLRLWEGEACARWAAWWAAAHNITTMPAGLSRVECRRIEWRYLDEGGEA